MSKSFSEIIKSDKLTLVDFFAEWCGPCKKMKPVLEELKKKVGDNVTILKIDVDKNQQAAEAYKIQAMPTLILFKHGEIKWQQAGLVTAKSLVDIINKYS